MIFASPAWLWALLLVPLAAALALHAARRDQERTARLVARPLWSRVLTRPAERWRWIRLALALTGIAALAFALARPQWGIVREKVEREGVDVVLVLDSSGSMATEDVPPSRFFLAKAALIHLVQRLEGDRFGLVAFEGEAYPLVPLTLDADAVGLFLDTVEPGIVPAPGSSLGEGLAKGLAMFVDEQRRNKVLVLVSDGEDLEGEVDAAVARAKQAGVVVHTVGVGTESGQPVPDFDSEGRRAGFKKDDDGSVVVSRLNAATLEAIARGTGGGFFRLAASDPSLSGLAGAIEGMEQKTLAREYSYRKKERFQVPLALALGCFTLALVLPLPVPPRAAHEAARRAAAVALALLAGATATAQTSPEPQPRAPAASAPTAHGAAAPEPRAARGSVLDEVLLRPRRLSASGREEYERGNHPKALEAFDAAAGARPQDARTRFNLADALYKNARFDEAGALYRALGADARAPLAAASRYNLGNALYQKQDYAGAVQAYRDALRVAPADVDAKRNLELALRALQKQKQDEQEQQQEQRDRPQDGKDQERQDRDQQQQDPKPDGQQKQPSPRPGERPKTEEEKEQERFQKETGMPKERAMQLLDALQQNEKAEQKKQLAARKAKAPKRKDW
jgi:Ca-activated chloride channel family protein